MLFKRLLDIFRTKPYSQTKGEITCTECGLVYDNTLGFFKREANECPDCQYIKILTDKSFDEMSDGLRVIRTIRGETAIKAAKDRLINGKPAPIDNPEKMSNIDTGTFDNDLDKLKDYDWIC